MEFLSSIEHWHVWLVIAFIILIVELLSGTFFLLALAGGGLLTSLLSWLIMPSTTMELFIFAVCSGIAYMILTAFRIEKEIEITDGTTHMIGQEVKVVEAIHHRGRVNYKGVLWQAKSEDLIEADAYAQIVAVDGSTLTVKALQHQHNKE